MTINDDERLRYPIGRHERAAAPTPGQRPALILAIADTPAALRSAVSGLTDAQLDTPYRAGGWSVRQVAHHLPDSHMNAYIRLKMALTEEYPVIKPYDEERWAELADSRTRVETSLVLLEALHERWVLVLRSLEGDQWERRFVHPALGVMTLDEQLALYAWHGRHHVAHITSLRERNGW